MGFAVGSQGRAGRTAPGHAARTHFRLALEEAINLLSGTNGALYAAGGRIELDCVTELGKDDADLRHGLRAAAKEASDAGTAVVLRDRDRRDAFGGAPTGARLAIPGFLEGQIAVTVVVGGIDLRRRFVEDHIIRFEPHLLALAQLVDRLRR